MEDSERKRFPYSMHLYRDVIVIFCILINYSLVIHYFYSQSKLTISAQINKGLHTSDVPKHTGGKGSVMEIQSALPLAGSMVSFSQQGHDLAGPALHQSTLAI